MTDSTTADNTGADVVKNALDQANHFEGSAKESVRNDSNKKTGSDALK